MEDAHLVHHASPIIASSDEAGMMFKFAGNDGGGRREASSDEAGSHEPGMTSHIIPDHNLRYG